MARYFSLKELTRSATASSLGIDNTPDDISVENLTLLADNVLDPIRELWGAPLIVNSGYRSAELNKAIKGASKSQHMSGQAADITTGRIGDNKILFGMIQKSGIPFNQLIDENNYSWIHVSYSERNRREVLHLKQK